MGKGQSVGSIGRVLEGNRGSEVSSPFGVEHVTINGVGHFLQDGGAEQLLGAIAALISTTPPASIEPLRAGPLGGEAAIAAKAVAEAAATERAVAHGDVGISTPSDGGVSFIAPTPEGRTPYQ
mgnify:CR=1 FL=1